MKRIASIITRHWKPLLAFNLLVISFTVVKIKSSSKIWEANAQLIMPERTGNLNANLGTLGSLNSGDPFSSKVNPLIAQESILNSDVLMQQVLASDPEKDQFPRLKSYKNLFQVEISEKSTTIDLTVNASSPELAQERAEKWIEMYQQRLNQLRKEDSQARINFSQKELEQTKQQLEDAQRKLAQFEQASGLVDSDEQTSGIIQLINQLSAAKYEAQVKAEANRKKVQALSARLGLTPSQAIGSVSLSENQNYQSIKQKLIELDIELGQLTTIRTDADPQVQELRLQRDKLRNQLQQYVPQGVAEAKIDTTVANNAGRTDLIQELILAESQAQAQTKEAEKLGNELEKLQGTLITIPVNKNILQNLQKEKDVAEGVYQGLIAKLQQAKIDAFNTFAHVQVLEPAHADPRPVEPKIMLIKLNAFFAAVVGSTALVKLLEKRNPLLSAKDLEFYDFPVLGCINNFQYFGRSLKTSDFWLNLLSQPNTQIELDFQRLASAVSLQPLENRRLLVTSATRGEGKTTVTIGLAKALADLGYRVLMVDGDFYRAELTNSLTPITEEEVTDKPIQLASNLYLQTTWQKQVGNAALVKQGKFDQHLGMAELNEEYDYIVIDTPPVSLTNETALMATTISNVLYVVRPNISERNCVFSSFEQLHQHNAKILGLVINGVENSSRPYSKGYLEPVKTQVLSQKSHN